MTLLRTIWRGESARSRRALIAGCGGIVVGVLLIVIGEIAGWGWTRLVGALLITAGAIGVGIPVGIAAARPRQPQPQPASWRMTVALIAAVILVLPVVAALLAALIGLLAGGARNAGLLALGAIIALILLAVTLLSTAIAVGATRRATATIHAPPRAAVEEQ